MLKAHYHSFFLCVIAFCLAFFSSSALAQSWVEVSGIPGQVLARHHPVAFSFDGYGHMVTGSTASQDRQDHYRYDAANDSWERLADFPGGARGYAIGLQADGVGYLGFGSRNGTYLNDLWAYDFTSETWSQLPSCPCAGRAHPAFLEADGFLYVGLGNDGFGNKRDWWSYSISDSTWARQADFPGPRRHHPYMFSVDEIPYVGMGHGSSIYNDLYQYDRATDSWIQMTSLPGEARVAGTQFDYNGKGYVLSGDGDNHSWMPTGEFWEYDPLLNAWTQLPPHPGTSRWAPGSFVIDGMVYFFGGLDNSALQGDMWAYDLNPPSSTTVLSAQRTTIYPNPAQDWISIALQPAGQDARIYDANGRVITSFAFQQNPISIGHLPAGNYFLEVRTEESLHVAEIAKQ